MSSVILRIRTVAAKALVSMEDWQSIWSVCHFLITESTKNTVINIMQNLIFPQIVIITVCLRFFNSYNNTKQIFFFKLHFTDERKSLSEVTQLANDTRTRIKTEIYLTLSLELNPFFYTLSVSQIYINELCNIGRSDFEIFCGPNSNPCQPNGHIYA